MKNNDIYFEEERSLAAGNYNIGESLRTLANRYIANNPPKPLVLRAFHEENFHQEFCGRYIFNFNEKFPDAKDGEYAYAFSYAFLDYEWLSTMSFRSKSPTWVYMNGELVFETKPVDEGLYKEKRTVLHYKKGINTFLIKCKKNTLDFGCEFGAAVMQHGALIFLNPTEEYYGMRGWAYTKPQGEDIFSDVQAFPNAGDAAGELWLPVPAKVGLDIDKVLGCERGYAYAMTYLKNNGIAKNYSFDGRSKHRCSVYVDGEKCFEGSGEIAFKKKLSNGTHTVTVQIAYENEGASEFMLEASAEFSIEEKIIGSHGKWLYLGKLKNSDQAILENPDMYRVYDGINGKCYWKTDEENVSVRLSSETEYYGKWTYPIGVVLYGLNEMAKEIADKSVSGYTMSHMSECVDTYEYALWDTETYGRAGLDFQMVMIDALDYCGSCGNAMLNVMGYDNVNAKNVADMIADYMKNKQERLENGMFYRKASGSYQENSIWADDLYMSVPFLCRYYKATGEAFYLEDAITQFKGFREYLYMPERKIMSHVYNLNYGKKNEIPWGRGNGWVVFALSELLAVCPENHPDFKFLSEFFAELCESYLSYQDENGLWHQVIDEPGAYYESSCTSMYVYAFARGIRNGWLKDEKFAFAAIRGWEALCKYCIDSHGNLYAVCVGSALSFRREYYLNELGWNMNDTHGTGIALLAGVEILRMQKNIN